MEVLIILGAAALIGAYASSRNSRDRELSRLVKRALGDAKKASKRNDPQAAAYYMQVARDISVQRLVEAEQRALNEAKQLHDAGHPRRAEKRLAKAREIRNTLVRNFQQQPRQPATSLPIATPPPTYAQQASSAPAIAYPAIPPYPEYTTQTQSQPSASSSSTASASATSSSYSYNSVSYLPPAPRYEASVPNSAPPPPPDAVRYYNQSSTMQPGTIPYTQQQQQLGYHVAAMPYVQHQLAVPLVAPPPYVPSISSSPSAAQPWEVPSKVH